MRRRTLLLLVAGLSVLSGAALSVADRGLDDRQGRQVSSSNVRSSKPGLRVSARVKGLLYPGARRPLLVRVKNLHGRPVVVTSVRVRVRRASRGCPRRSLRLGRFAVRVRVPPRRRRVVRLRASMRPASADGCQGARFRLRVRVRARGDAR